MTAGPQVQWQGNLLGADQPQWRDLAGCERIDLGRGAWVDRLPGWLSGADEAIPELLRGVPWRSERRAMYDAVVDVPRLTAYYPRYRALPSEVLVEAGDRLTRHYGVRGHEDFETAGLCLYRTGADSVAWHGDRLGRGAAEDLLVAVLSLGSQRRFALRPRGGGTAVSFTVRDGDLLVMGGSCQRTWDHCVPKTRTAAGARISVQYRPRGIA